MAAEPRSGDDLARLLMEKAAGDEKILLRLIDEDDIPDDGLGFHAQQAVEKMIKAILAHNEIVYERTHNIARTTARSRSGPRSDAHPGSTDQDLGRNPAERPLR